MPTVWEFAVLALAAFRLTRLISYDTFPLVVRWRCWVLGIDGDTCRRPLLAELFSCYFCLGFWTALAVYAVWLVVPTAALYASVPFALSAVVGLVAKNLDE